MRLRRNSDDVASASADPAAAPAPRPGSQPAASDISSIGVAIMPGMPLPDWVTTASLAAPAVASAAPIEPPAATGAYPQVDPAFEAALAARQAAPMETAWAQTPAFEAAAPAYPQVNPAYEAALAGVAASAAAASVPAAVPVPVAAADLPAPDPAQWSEHPNGTVVWGPVPTPATPAPAIDLPIQAPVEAGVAAAAPVAAAANALAFAAPPTGPAFFFDPPDDAADLEAPDLQEPAPHAATPKQSLLAEASWAAFDEPADAVPADEPLQEQPPSTFDVTPDDPGPADEVEPAPVFPPDTTADWPAFRAADVTGDSVPPTPASVPADAPVAQPWFATNLPEDQPPASAGGAGQYGWLFQPDESPQQDSGGTPGSSTAWFDPGGTSTPEASAEATWGATATTASVQWSQEPPAEPGDAIDWMAAPQLPLATVVAGNVAASADSELAAHVAPTAPAPADRWVPAATAPVTQPSASTTTPGIVPMQQAPRMEALAAPAPVAAASPVAAPVAPPAVAPAPPLPTPAAVQTPPPPPVAGPPQPRPGRSRRWLVIAAIGALVAALALVALYVYPGFLKPADPVSAPPTIVTPATAGDLTRTAKVDAPVAAAFRRTAAALSATPSSKYATYTSGQGESATVWDSNGSSDSPAATMRAYESAGGVALGRLASVPAGARGGSMACAAASATRTVCFWNADGVVGAADVLGLARTEAGALAARMRTALEQPA